MPEELSDEIKREILRLVEERVSELHMVVDDRVRELLDEREADERRDKIARQEAFEERYHRLKSTQLEELEL